MFNLVQKYVIAFLGGLLIILYLYGSYWHNKALKYENSLQIVTEQANLIQKNIDDIEKEQKQKKSIQDRQIKIIQNAKVSDNCQEAMDWMKYQLIIHS